MSNALSVYKNLDQMQSMSRALSKSGFFSDANSPDKALVKILAGAELGLPPFASMSGIHIIKGKASLGANLLAGLVKSHPKYDYRVRETSAKICTLEFFEGGESLGTVSFDAQQAKQAGVQNMNKFPQNMLFARAMSNGVKFFCPDVTSGAPVYTPDELGAAVDENGEMVNVTPPVDNNIVEAETIEDEPQNKRLFIQFQDAAKAAYGDEWQVKKTDVIGWLTKKRVTSSKDMTNDELEKGIRALGKKIAANREAEQAIVDEVEAELDATQAVLVGEVVDAVPAMANGYDDDEMF